MSWPQIVVLILLLLNAAVWLFGFATSEDFRLGLRIIGVVVVLGLTALTFGALSAGGFW